MFESSWDHHAHRGRFLLVLTGGIICSNYSGLKRGHVVTIGGLLKQAIIRGNT